MQVEVIVGIDGDGHFMVASLYNKPDVIRLLRNIEDGDHWANEIHDEYDELTIQNFNSEEWVEWVKQFQCRGRMEIVKFLF